MGSFIGHAIPGSFFYLFGLWWVTQVFRRHFRCRQSREPFRATLTFPVPLQCCPVQRLRSSDLPVEAVVKMVLCGLGIIVEIIGGTNHISHRFDSIGNAQHITMYFFFGLTGVFDVLVLKDLAPRGSDYAAVGVALMVEGALFKFHLFGRDELDVLLHTLLLYVIGFSVLVLVVEAAFRNNALLPLLRGLLFMQQGTWFWGVAYILYNPFPGARPWDPEDHHALMLAVVCFSWHAAVNLLFLMAVGGVTGCCYRNRGGRARYSKLDTVPLEELENGNGEGEGEKGGVGGRGGLFWRGGVSGGLGGGGGNGGGGKSESVPLVVGQDGQDLSDLEFEAPLVK
ncbi:transmembrane protein 45B-like [Babylonia areolata]|uniref:transmembrane protein 45B-like n=1 Tax=Babylonia areolata TaxID=304850 RepID=UPI003FD360BF